MVRPLQLITAPAVGVLAMAGGSTEGVLAMADAAAGAVGDGDDDAWCRRQAMRMMAFPIVKDSPANQALHQPVEGPGPEDRNIRKRGWAHLDTARKEKIRFEGHHQLMKQISALDLRLLWAITCQTPGARLARGSRIGRARACPL